MESHTFSYVADNCNLLRVWRPCADKVAEIIEGKHESATLLADTILSELSHGYQRRIVAFTNPAASPSRELMIRAFAERDREKLLQLSKPLFTVLEKENPYFKSIGWILPDNHVFLRLKYPEKFGNDVSKVRPDVAAVNQDKKQHSGFDVGFKSMQYRIVQPVFYHGEYLGAVQFGFTASILFDALQSKLNTIAGMAVLNEECDLAQKTKIPKLRCRTHTIRSHDVTTFEPIQDQLDWNRDQQRVVLNGRAHIIISVLPLLNFQNEKLGVIFVALDISEELAQKRKLLITVLVTSSALLILSFLILYFSYGALVQKIINLNQSLEKNNLELENRVNERTAKLQGSERRFRLLVENVPDSIFLFDTHGKFIDANKQASKTLGYTLNELQNLSVADIDTKFSSEDVTQLTTEILSDGKTIIVQGIHQRKDGSTFPVEIHVAMMEIEGRPLYFALAHDITNRLKAAEVAQQEASLGRIIEKSLNEIYIFAADTLMFIQVNKGARENIGYSLEELQNLTSFDIKPEFTKEVFEEKIKPLKDNKIEKLAFETWHQRKDGSKYPVEIHLQKTTYQGAQVFVAISLDISQRKEAEKKIQEAFDIINRSASIAFLWNNTEDWPVEFVSDNVLGLTGYSSQEFTSGTISYTECIHPDDLERVSREVEEAGKDPHIESFAHTPYRIITKNKEIKWVSDHSQARKDEEGRITHYQGIVEDITDRKKNELALQKSQEEWEKTFNAMSDIVTIQDKDMRIVRANKAAHDFFEVDFGELAGKYCYEVFSGIAEPCPGCPVLKTLENIQCHSEVIHHEKLGKIFHVSSAPILDENNEIGFLVHIAKDITEQKQLEEELFQAHKMEAIGTLAGGIAHDFNNILSAVIGFSELAKDHIPPDNPARKDIDLVIQSSRRAVDLVKQILTFSRKSEHDLQSLNPHLIVKEVLRMLSSSLPSTVIIHEDIDKGCGRILADPTNIHQILLNLCTNAFHAMEKETGTLTVKLYRKEIAAEEIVHESGVSAGSFVVLSVSDTGHGMDEATKERIFEPYFTTKEMGKGTGMGLAVIHGIIQDYNGFVRVDSTLGEGSTFSVYLPALDEKAISPEDSSLKEPENKSLSTGKERILVVDDEPLLVKIHKKQLEKYGYAVTGTTDSMDALEKIRAQPDQFDLLITDQTMPRLSGVELANEVHKIRPALPIILCTGHSDVVSKKDALAMGIKKYVPKPIQRDELFLAIRDVLDGK